MREFKPRLLTRSLVHHLKRSDLIRNITVLSSPLGLWDPGPSAPLPLSLLNYSWQRALNAFIVVDVLIIWRFIRNL